MPESYRIIRVEDTVDLDPSGRLIKIRRHWVQLFTGDVIVVDVPKAIWSKDVAQKIIEDEVNETLSLME